jgi:hypothetical protein
MKTQLVMTSIWSITYEAVKVIVARKVETPMMTAPIASIMRPILVSLFISLSR